MDDLKTPMHDTPISFTIIHQCIISKKMLYKLLNIDKNKLGDVIKTFTKGEGKI